MDNSINNVSFRARLLTTNVKISNARRMHNISKKFSTETIKFSDDKYNLYMSEYITKDKQPMMRLSLKNIDSNGWNNKNYNTEDNFITQSLDEYLATTTDTKIARKLANVFKVLHYKNVLNNKLPTIKAAYEKAEKSIYNLLPKVTSNKEKQMIKEIEAMIQKLQKQYMRIRTTALQNIRRAVKGDSELENFSKDIL